MNGKSDNLFNQKAKKIRKAAQFSKGLYQRRLEFLAEIIDMNIGTLEYRLRQLASGRDILYD